MSGKVADFIKDAENLGASRTEVLKFLSAVNKLDHMSADGAEYRIGEGIGFVIYRRGASATAVIHDKGEQKTYLLGNLSRVLPERSIKQIEEPLKIKIGKLLGSRGYGSYLVVSPKAMHGGTDEKYEVVFGVVDPEGQT